MKRYIVFLKQVPQSTRVEIDPVTNTLKRSSALCQTNPDDLCALQAALNLKKETQAEVVVVSMGPGSAETVLREALQHGADRAVLLSSPAFAGSDTWCTSKVLAAAVQKIGTFDLLFFGRMAIDGDTAQVGPEVAGQLGIPQVTQLIRIEGITPSSIWLAKRAGNVRQQMEIAFPCAVMVSKENGEVAPPTLTGWREAQKKMITCWNEKDLNLDAGSVGLHASPTKVVSTEVPQNKKSLQWLADGAAVMQVIYQNIHSQKK